MRAMVTGLLLALSAIVCSTSASAYDAYDPNNCNGVRWNDEQALTVAKVTARPRVNFVKSPYDDDFKAESCPAATDACRKTSYLITDDIVLVGPTQRDFTCVVYRSPVAKKQVWTQGWVPSSALAPVTPMPSPKPSDWIGSWTQPGGSIEITQGRRALHAEGSMAVPTARDVHTGAFEADVTLANGMISLTDSDDCRVRMQRIGAWLLVEDNDGCGGAAVTFTGLYRRKK